MNVIEASFNFQEPRSSATRDGREGVLVQRLLSRRLSKLVHPPNDSFSDILFLPSLVIDDENTPVEDTSRSIERLIRQPLGSIISLSFLDHVQLCEVEVDLKPLRAILNRCYRVTFEIHSI